MTTIHAAVLHKLSKDAHKPATVQTRDAELELTPTVQSLVDQINDLYGNRASKGYGRFEDDELTYPTAPVLRDMFKDRKTSFVDGTKQLMKVLAGKAMQASASKGGYVLMVHGRSKTGDDWLLVAIINNVASTAVNEKTLEIEEAVHIDLENVRVAGRVNLSAWLSGDPHTRYVGFLKARGDVAEYFMYFLGCRLVVKDTEDTKRLVTGLKDFAHSEGLDQQATDEFLRRAHGYCIERSKAREPVSLEELTNFAWPAEPKKLQQALASDEIELSDGFVPDSGSLRKLLKFHGKTPFWTVALDRRALSKGHAEYIAERGELVLRNLPDALKAELQAEMNDD
ncbi:nucleoid-associated protein [Aquariibacter albus]|uniref:Nucleoid-associated protein n=1 Tax=Aquariibacter albus TaxID=2759899 RepID=A0A839HV34_9BURK|nr:nucleoid-associated protein [Aquariibacter albus]MBB1162234.1 nucleoid-associated protein [Aquariibacter albus]